MVLRSSCALLLTIQFALFFIFFYFLFFATILSVPYLWNHYSQRLQIECAAWSCGLILHCCLPSNSLFFFFFFFFFFLQIFFFFFFFFFFLQTRAHTHIHPRRFFFFFRHDFVRRRIFHLRGIAPRSHTGRPRTCLV